MPPRTPPIFGRNFNTTRVFPLCPHPVKGRFAVNPVDRVWRSGPVSCCFWFLFMGVFFMCMYWFVCRDGYFVKCDNIELDKFKYWYSLIKWDLVEGEVWIGNVCYYFLKGKWKKV